MALGRVAGLLLSATLLAPSLGAPGEGQCAAGDAACSAAPGAGAARQHPWPNARGPIGSYGVSRYRAPRNLSASLAWNLTDGRGRGGIVLNGGLVIDDKLNIYTAATNGLHKVSPDGQLLWSRHGGFSGAPVLDGDTLYGDSKDGMVYALDLETGTPRWEKKVTDAIGPDCHSVGVSEGVVITNVDGKEGGGASTVIALNTSTGETIWTFKPDSQLWNIMPMFTGNGSVLFQDQVGRGYHLDLFTGKSIWRNGVQASFTEFWTDGMSWLGPNGLFYVVHVHGVMEQLAPTTPSDLRAYRVSDGEFVWRKDFPYPINSQPVVAQLREGESPSLVMNSGLQAGIPLRAAFFFSGMAGLFLGVPLALLLLFLSVLCRRCESPRRRTMRRCCLFPVLLSLLMMGLGGASALRMFHNKFPSEVQVLDAATGELRWRYEFPVWNSFNVRGDDELFFPRIFRQVQPFCIPNGWGSPSVDASGTVWLGHQNGHIYGLRDEDGDGRISESEVVATFDMGASSTQFGGAYAPGMLAWASCDTVFVFKE